MIRITFRLRLRWPWRRAAQIDADRRAEPREIVFGPGWFDSSWDLGSGLDVREDEPTLPSVSEWLLLPTPDPQAPSAPSTTLALAPKPRPALELALV